MLNFLKKIFGFGAKTISQSEAKNLTRFLDAASKKYGKQALIEIDTIYHNTLQTLGYSGSFGEILKQNPKEVKNINDIWELHKLRNSLVHELRDFDDRYIIKMSKKYEEITRNFIRQVTK